MNRNTEGQVKEIRIFPIGYIRSPYQKGQAVPAQGDLRDGQTARIFLLPQYKEGIADLKAGDYGVILFRIFHPIPSPAQRHRHDDRAVYPNSGL